MLVQRGVNRTLCGLELIKYPHHIGLPSVFLLSGGQMLFRRLGEMVREKLNAEESDWYLLTLNGSHRWNKRWCVENVYSAECCIKCPYDVYFSVFHVCFHVMKHKYLIPLIFAQLEKHYRCGTTSKVCTIEKVAVDFQLREVFSVMAVPVYSSFIHAAVWQFFVAQCREIKHARWLQREEQIALNCGCFYCNVIVTEICPCMRLWVKMQWITFIASYYKGVQDNKEPAD